MPLFSLPLADSVQRSTHIATQSIRLASLPTRKRKRRLPSPSHDASSVIPSDDDNELSDGESHPPAASTNPLSLTPDEILQYQVAGLELDEHLPSYSGFPHRGPKTAHTLNQSSKNNATDKDDESHDETEDEEGLGDVGTVGNGKAQRGPRLRMQHVAVLTTILHKCLLDDDIPRASRAFAMLVRTEVGGRVVNLRSTGYWLIGAHLLNKSLDEQANVPGRTDDNENDEEKSDEHQQATFGPEREWGTKEGRSKAKEFFNKLILQHPYKRQYHRTITALDIWPIMVTWEIYGIQYEQKEGLRKVLVAAQDEVDFDDIESSEDVAEISDVPGSEDSFAFEKRKNERRLRRREERAWDQREQVRQTTLLAAQALAARVDDLMNKPPYSDNPTVMEIRAHLAVYIGDLSVPEKPLEEVEFEDDGLSRNRLNEHGADSERRLLFRQRLYNHESGKRTQEDELDKAKTLVAKIANGGGNVDDFASLEPN